jgi:hypothetical protein
LFFLRPSQVSFHNSSLTTERAAQPPSTALRYYSWGLKQRFCHLQDGASTTCDSTVETGAIPFILCFINLILWKRRRERERENAWESVCRPWYVAF